MTHPFFSRRLDGKSCKWIRINEKTPAAARARFLHELEAAIRCRFALLPSKACGAGLDMDVADTCVLLVAMRKNEGLINEERPQAQALYTEHKFALSRWHAYTGRRCTTARGQLSTSGSTALTSSPNPSTLTSLRGNTTTLVVTSDHGVEVPRGIQ